MTAARDEVLGVDRRATLNDALDDMLTSSHGGAIVTGRREEFVGVASFASVRLTGAADPSAGTRKISRLVDSGSIRPASRMAK